MGIRGPLPTLSLRPAKQLNDLSAPDWLPTEGKAFWSKHARQLADNNLLTTATADSFALCCDLWARLQEFRGQPTTRAYLDTGKAFNQLAKLFRLLPCDKPGAPVQHRHEDKGEFQMDDDG